MSTHDVPGAKAENHDVLAMGCWAEHADVPFDRARCAQRFMSAREESDRRIREVEAGPEAA
jgi:hypothetical protein